MNTKNIFKNFVNDLKTRKVFAIGLLLIGLALCGISLGLSLHFFFLTGDFKIISKKFICEQPLNNRCVEHNQVLDRSNGKEFDFVPLAYGFTSEDIIVGSEIKKHKFSFSYLVNSSEKNWQYRNSQLLRLIFGTGLIVKSLSMVKRLMFVKLE